MKMEEKKEGLELNRRDFLKGTAAAAAVAAVSGPFSLARAAGPEIRVGMTLTYTGVYAMVGKRVENGIRLAFALSKYKDQVKFFTEDTQGKPNVAIEKAQKLFEKEQIHILAGPIAGHESLAVSEMLKPKKKLMLLAYGANIKLCGESCSRYTFLCGHTPWNQSYPAVDWFLKTLGKKVYLIGADYSTGHEVVKFFKEPFEKKGGQVVGSFFSPLGTTEFAPYLAKIKSASPKPDGIFGFIGGNDLINFVKQYAEFGLQKEKIPIIVGLGGFSPVLVPAMAEAAVGNYHVFHYSNWLENKENEAFKAAYIKMFPGEISDESVLLGYEVGTMMVKGLEAAGGKPEDTEKIINGIEKADYRSPRGHVKMDPNHVANVPIYIFQVVKQDGKYILKTAAYTGNYGTPYSGPDAPGGECKMGR
ncbi:MAG: ABC transporter substrate-binding protein [Deltaproteobacteria bacterium]|nr:ABC transporter substrate-binding protein [Deltaproteobacteria bacterium]